MSENLSIQSKWSNEMTQSDIKDWRYVVNTVFGPFCTEEYFKRKYLDNIYGPSLLTVAYVDKKPVGADALWRNDIDGKEAYQTTDTSVLAEYRRRGIYSTMLQGHQGLSRLEGKLLYGFPNHNSLPCRIRLGWDCLLLYKSVVFFPFIFLLNLQFIDSGYAAWWLQSRGRICYLKYMGKYYLVKYTSVNTVVCILGRVDEKTALCFPRMKGLKTMAYHYSDRSSVIGRHSRTVAVVHRNGGKRTDVGYWKADFV